MPGGQLGEVSHQDESGTSKQEIAGLGKEQWGALHSNLGILFVAAGLVHTVLDWKPIMTDLKTRAKKLRISHGSPAKQNGGGLEGPPPQ